MDLHHADRFLDGMQLLIPAFTVGSIREYPPTADPDSRLYHAVVHVYSATAHLFGFNDQEFISD